MQKKNLLPILLLPFGIAVVALIYYFPPAKYHFWPPCAFNKLTGLYCPGCGNTRALAALVHGDIVDCFAKNILFIPALICLLVLCIYPKISLNRYFSGAIAIVVILFFILRNLPWYPFCLLAPH